MKIKVKESLQPCSFEEKHGKMQTDNNKALKFQFTQRN